MNRLPVILITMLVITCSACRNRESIVGPAPPPSTVGVYILNEGGFSGGGSLAYYDKDLDSIFHGILGPAQGWVFPNDMKIVGTKGYVAINGSDRIDIIDITNNTITGSITFPQFTGPGFFAVDGLTMYVANYNGSVSIIDLAQDSLKATISSVVSFPGGIAFANGSIFVSDMGLFPSTGTLVKVIDPEAGIVSDSITVQNAPGGLAVVDGRIFVTCTGTGNVYRIHPVSLEVEDSVQLPDVSGDIATNGDTLYVLGFNAVAKLYHNPITIIDTTVIARTSGSFFYSMIVDEATNNIYVSNIVSSGGTGEIEIYSPSGTLIRPPLPVGIFPGAFALKQ